MTDTDSRLKVMIVDDDAAVRSTIAEVIKSFDLHCSQAGSGNQAMRMMAQSSFEIVFLDVSFPDGSGFEVL